MNKVPGTCAWHLNYALIGCTRESALGRSSRLPLMKRAAWADHVRWNTVRIREGCPICVAGQPRDVIAEGTATWVTAAREADLPGYACVVSKRHVVEPFELSPEDAISFWAEAMNAARLIAALTAAAKLNYGIHGNVIPHLHMHLWPRFAEDPYDIGGIPVDAPSFSRSPAQIDALKEALVGYAPARGHS